MMHESKIGILTTSNSINYGACLQTYALQRYLRNEGYVAEVVDFRPQAKGRNQSALRRLRSFVWDNTLRPLLRDRKRESLTKSFRRDFVNYSENVFFNADELRNSSLYKTMIVGSDQIWNPRYAMFDDGVWFLDFPQVSTKVAYAASFGISALPEYSKEEYARRIRKMDAVSVREETGANIIQELIGCRPNVVMDPVFLLDQEQWKRFAVEPAKSNYVLCYYMPGFPRVEKEIEQQALRLAKEKDLETINIGKRELSKLELGGHNVFGVGPREFVGLIANAEYVVTNSFHGTAFSVLFRKRFLSIVDSGLGSKTLSSRLVDLLERINAGNSLRDLAKAGPCSCEAVPSDGIEILRKEIEASKLYLKKALDWK